MSALLRGLLALALLTSCAGPREPASQDAVLVDVPAQPSADAYASGRPGSAAPPVARDEPIADPGPQALEQPPITRTLAPPPAMTTVASAPPVASGSANDRATARQLFSEGLLAFDRAEYKRARDLFETAYKLAPNHKVLLNIGVTAKQLGDRKGICKAFKAYLKEASPEEAKREEAQIKKDCP